jgi:tRNA U34 5-methylaminomethyl-2-thiouridine-forming methyltransferase MnmC
MTFSISKTEPEKSCTMQKLAVTTADGSKTLFIPEWNEHYHSKFGALTESVHIFINNGLDQIEKQQVSILEIGFGTGLNTILTYQYAQKTAKNIRYEAIEKYPLTVQEVSDLNYKNLMDVTGFEVFLAMHGMEWGTQQQYGPNFLLKKAHADLLDFLPQNMFDIIYFDAFAPDLQPELWSAPVFENLFACLNNGGLLVTYSTKGMVKQNLKSVGFEIEKFMGPEGGKKECLRAWKK